MPPEPARVALGGVRRVIDGLDDGLLVLLAGRRACVRVAERIKRAAQLPLRDLSREQAVRQRAQRIGKQLGLPDGAAERVAAAVIDDACRQQGLPPADLDQGGSPAADAMLPATMNATTEPRASALLRLIPPPGRVAPLLRVLPSRWQAPLLEIAMARVLAAPLSEGALAPLQDRRLGIEVSDLGLRWVVALRDGRMQVCPSDSTAEATVRGSATDLLLLASRREDADTLFFQRRLVLTGDTELGLTARNLLDQLPWESIPLGLRIVLHRGAGLAEAARAAHHRPLPA